MLLYPLAYPLDFFWVIVGEHPDYSSPSPQSFAALVLPPEATHFAGCHRGIQPLLCPSKFQCSNEHWEPNLFSLHLEPLWWNPPLKQFLQTAIETPKIKTFFHNLLLDDLIGIILWLSLSTNWESCSHPTTISKKALSTFGARPNSSCSLSPSRKPGFRPGVMIFLAGKSRPQWRFDYLRAMLAIQCSLMWIVENHDSKSIWMRRKRITSPMFDTTRGWGQVCSLSR